MPQGSQYLPVRQFYDTSPPGSHSSAGRRLGRRLCLNKGCGVVFEAKRWNQHYCGGPECRREVRRWQAVKRQRRRRKQEERRAEHAAAERERRRRKASLRTSASISDVPPSAAIDATADCAWSRGRPLPENFCDRPGCYEAVRTSRGAPARYCGDACRQAVRRVDDRERKWLRRNTCVGRAKRQGEYRRAQRKAASLRQPSLRGKGPRSRNSVVNSARRASFRLSCGANKERPP